MDANHASGRLVGFLVLAAVILAVVSGVALWAAQKAQTNTGRINRIVRVIKQHADKDEQSIRSTTYRICVRQMQLRAAVILHVDRTPNNALLAVLPIFDCTPDLNGQPARKLTPRETRTFLRHFDHRQALAP